MPTPSSACNLQPPPPTPKPDSEDLHLDRRPVDHGAGDGERRRAGIRAVSGLQDAERRRDMDKAADLKYYAIPEVEDHIKAAKQALDEQQRKEQELEGEGKNSEKLVVDVVGPEQISEVIARWTGIPTSKLSQAENDRLLRLPATLRSRVVGQNEAIESISDAPLPSSN